MGAHFNTPWAHVLIGFSSTAISIAHNIIRTVVIKAAASVEAVVIEALPCTSFTAVMAVLDSLIPHKVQ